MSNSPADRALAASPNAAQILHAPTPSRDLPGDIAVWFFIFAELLAFGIFFVGYGFARAGDPQGFAARQQLLLLPSGLINTGLLLGSSYALVLSGLALRRGELVRCQRWLDLTLLPGALFLLHKLFEFRHMAALGWWQSEHTFDLFYLWMTFFHFLHVALGVVVLLLIRARLKRGYYTPSAHAEFEGASVYWHMVDMVWLILFPLLYVL